MQMTLFLNSNCTVFQPGNVGHCGGGWQPFLSGAAIFPKGRYIKLAQARILNTTMEQWEHAASIAWGMEKSEMFTFK